MKTILIPTDFSKNASNAVKYAYSYAALTKSKVVLFHTYLLPGLEVSIPFSDIHYSKNDAKLVAEANMKKLVKSLAKSFPDVKHSWVIQHGNPSKTIVEFVEKNKIDMVIMGTKGQNSIASVLIGNTTSNMIKELPCNILAIPPMAKFKGIHNIAIATDLKKVSLLAVDELVSFAKHLDASIIFIHVDDFENKDVEKKLEKMAIKIKSQVNYKKISLILYKDISIENGLDFFIKTNKPDIFSMVTHHTKFPEQLWKTSWTDKMSKHISVPLLIVHIEKISMPKQANHSNKTIQLDN